MANLSLSVASAACIIFWNMLHTCYGCYQYDESPRVSLSLYTTCSSPWAELFYFISMNFEI